MRVHMHKAVMGAAHLTDGVSSDLGVALHQEPAAFSVALPVLCVHQVTQWRYLIRGCDPLDDSMEKWGGQGGALDREAVLGEAGGVVGGGAAAFVGAASVPLQRLSFRRGVRPSHRDGDSPNAHTYKPAKAPSAYLCLM